ncbi:hypothetical protein G6F57_005410 [Rhizopus arrhizus]|uniref:Uncharacterized protein n=1 Tax=Rhizopus oryzae TaxID=64495 RepID=A0A9P6XB07_RHIOR|nr:hypothetical protein G6F23_004245 [Rhizopus arrhizus]KAG1420125.1 hypothetical protein G6F58_004314 [Rhizopus delemar]KAG0761183.1 hypothetical protein G6F24_007758 [Rhizopus arrhizus]KAG0790636.1 hypothetical protein G6F22_006358 [Rhizopus arrhizus]KAG0791308.1 hypothetical protein G6F21_005180 [Rhizopus arrhizus]
MYKTKNQINKQLSLELKSRKSSENLRKEEKVKDNYKPLGVKLPLTLDEASIVTTMTGELQLNKSIKSSSLTSRTGKRMPANSYIPYIRLQKPQEFKPEQALNCTNNSAIYKAKQNLHQRKAETFSTTQLNKYNDLQFMVLNQQNLKKTMPKKWKSKHLNYQPALNIWNIQQKKMERRIYSIETLLNDFKELDLKTRLLEMHHHFGVASITTEASTIDTEEEADHEVDLGVKIGPVVNLFWQEEEAEVLLSPNNETIPFNSQQIQYPTTANNSTTPLFIIQYHNKNFASNQHYAIPQDGILPGGCLTHFYNYWTRITSHQWLLSIVKEEYKIQSASHPTSWKLKSSNTNPADHKQTIKLPRNLLSILSRRYLSTFKVKRRSIKNNPNGVPRIPIQHKGNEDYSTFTQDQQPSTEDQTNATANQVIVQMDCSSTRENYINDPSDRRSTSPYSSSSARFSKEPTIAQPELGKTLPDISTKSTRISMVEEINNNEERPTDSDHESTNTIDHNLHGQLRLRLGSELTNDHGLWFLEQGRIRNVNKRSRTENSILCVEDACKKIRKLHNKGFHRQHDSIEIHNKVWRNNSTPITGISSDDSGHLQQIQFEGNLSTYTGDKEHQDRPTIEATAATLRTDNSEKDVSTDFTTMGTTTNRRICCDTQPPIEEISEPSPGPIEEAQDAFQQRWLKKGIQSDYYEDQQEVFPSRLEIINEKRRKSGLMNEASIKYITKSTRKSTEKAYDNGWKHWQQWCCQQNPQIDPTAYNSTNILHFLVDNNKFSSNHLNTLRSSIVSVFRALHPEEVPLANQSIIQAFFAAKRRSEIKIPSTP